MMGQAYLQMKVRLGLEIAAILSGSSSKLLLINS
jgi:hypothetical protein